MPLRKIALVNDEYYHVFNRSIGKKYVFLDEGANLRFIKLIQYYKFCRRRLKFSLFNRLPLSTQFHILKGIGNEQQRVKILSYCLMPRHFHFLIEQKVENGISDFVGTVLSSFVQYLNRRDATHGPLFLPNFKAVHIQSDTQLKHASRYIHLNPVSSGIVKSVEKLGNYPWSSYREYISGALKVVNKVCDISDILALFDNDSERYVRFLEMRSGYQRSLEFLKSKKMHVYFPSRKVRAYPSRKG